VVTELGTKVDPDKDEVEYRGQKIKESQKSYLLLNKPAGYLCTVKKGRETGKTIFDLIKITEKLFPVGRLDRTSSGLLILTNDGNLGQKLTHPSREKEKEYEVETVLPLIKIFVENLRRRIILPDQHVLPKSIVQLSPKKFRIVLTEGRNRQIRRMVTGLKNEVISLKRIRLNNLTLGSLKPGEWRYLTAAEVRELNS
jgi:23S rRNA pseudouridine2605 synthase/23S rRNA pseudouridine2604 synthase